MRSPAHIRVAVISRNRLFGDGLVQLLSAEADLRLSTCDPIASSLARVASTHDIVLLDALICLDTARAAAIPEGGVVIFVGAPDDDAWAAAALSSGARGIITQAATRDEVITAVRIVHEGGIWARRRWLNACVRHIVGDGKRRLATRALVESRLSRREREVLRHAATGISNKELASRLCISEATVKVHLSRVFQKLGISSRAALAAAYPGNADDDSEPRATSSSSYDEGSTPIRTISS